MTSSVSFTMEDNHDVSAICNGLVREYLFRNGYHSVLMKFDEETVRDDGNGMTV